MNDISIFPIANGSNLTTLPAGPFTITAYNPTGIAVSDTNLSLVSTNETVATYQWLPQIPLITEGPFVME